jgi:Protein of unknown function (DUF2934)
MATRPPSRSRSKKSSAIPTLTTVVPRVPPADMPLPEPALDPNLGVEAEFTGERTDYTSREARIERLAYLIAQSRGFEPGHELDDWLAAERRIEAEEASAADENHTRW